MDPQSADLRRSTAVRWSPSSVPTAFVRRLLGAAFVSALALAPLLASGVAEAQGATAPASPSQRVGGSSVSTGTASLSTPFYNIFGWRGGSVQLSAEVNCQDDCNCIFAGPVTLAETLPIQECDILQVDIFKIVCGVDASCPGGVKWGEKAVITYECCVSVPPFGSYLCDTYVKELKACGN